MARLTVENPTQLRKAVRADGGLPVIQPGDRATFDVEWSEAEKVRYEAAGLIIKSAQGRPKAMKQDKEAGE